MKILVIIGECVQVNSSANLCHLSYLRGLVEAGHEVTLISSDTRGYIIDQEMNIPEGVKSYTYNSITMYEKLSELKRKSTTPAADNVNVQNALTNTKKRIRGIGSKLKRMVRSLYGPYGIYLKFVSTASRFHSNENYDVVLSLSSPPASHLLAYKLLHSGHVRSRHWIQVWEDPWSGDVFCTIGKDAVYKEEKHLLTVADRICYVSPITLAYQKASFPESAGKMFWVPLPAYYESSSNDSQSLKEGLFGYFGDYRKPARNLEPFYNAARDSGIEVNICGATNIKLDSTEKIHIYPRLPLTKLKPIEEKTEVLVFLSNCAGGQIPGKIYQYATTYKTVLFILDGTEDEKDILKDYFAQFNRFVFCENTAEDIKRAIQLIISGEIGEIRNIPLNHFKPTGIISTILEEGTK